MKIIIFATLLLFHALIVSGQSHERDWYQVFDPQRAEETEKKEFTERFAFFRNKHATTEDYLLIIEITAGFEYEDYLIKNEIRYFGSNDRELDKIKLDLIEDKDLKEQVVSWINEKRRFNKRYFHLRNIFSLRLECISYIWSATKNDQDGVAKNLSPEEKAMYLSLKRIDTKDDRYYFSHAFSQFELKRSTFFNKYDFKAISKTNPKMTISDYLDLLLTDERFCKTINIVFISDLLRPNNDKPIDIQLGTLIIKVWQKYKSLKVGLVDDPLLQGNLMGLLDDTLNLLKISDYQEHETILKELLTPELYKKVFIDHVKFLDIPEFVTAGRRALLYGHLHKQ